MRALRSTSLPGYIPAVIGLSIVYTIGFFVLLNTPGLPDSQRTWMGMAGRLLPLSFATYLSIQAGRKAIHPYLRRIWFYTGTGLLLWTGGSLVELIYGLGSGVSGRGVSLADLFYTAGYPPVALGVLVMLAHQRRQFGRLHLVLDLVISASALAALAWFTAIQPALAATPVELVGMFWAAAYPMLDIILLTITINILLVSEEAPLRLTLGVIAAALLAALFSDLYSASWMQADPYLSGSLIGLGWIISPCLLGVGAVYALQPGKHRPPLSLTFIKIQNRIQSLLPLAATLVLSWYTLVSLQLKGQWSTLAVWVVLFCAAGLILQQGVVAGEVELREYASLVDHAADPAFICNSQGQFLLANPALVHKLGYANEEALLGKPLYQILAPGDDLTWPDPDTSLDWSGEVRFRCQNGDSFPAYLSLRPVENDAGERRGTWLIPRKRQARLVGTAHDLTQHKRQQAALKQAYEQIATAHHALETLNEQLEHKVEEKTFSLSQAYAQLEQQHQTLQQLDELKSDFVSLVSHELRAPLTNIGGGIELVLSSASLPESTRQSLTLVQIEILRLNHFVESILDLSALDAGRIPIYPAPTTLSQIVSPLLRQISALPESRRITWEIPEHLPFLMADDRAVSSVLFHLIDNALKYAPHGVVEIRAWSQDGQVWVGVLDEGPGVPAEAMPMLFEKFFRLHNSDSQTVYGHGLGLYMVRRLLQAMQGDIQVENRPSGGACFTFRLPAVQEQDER